jgi:hypothetical protein
LQWLKCFTKKYIFSTMYTFWTWIHRIIHGNTTTKSRGDLKYVIVNLLSLCLQNTLCVVFFLLYFYLCHKDIKFILQKFNISTLRILQGQRCCDYFFLQRYFTDDILTHCRTAVFLIAYFRNIRAYRKKWVIFATASDIKHYLSRYLCVYF